MAALESLAQLLPPGRVATDARAVERHGEDTSIFRPRLPHAVVYPESTAEVQTAVRWAADAGVALVAFGAGSSVEGHVIPVGDCISIDLSRMDRIVETAPENRIVRVQPGIRRIALNEQLAGTRLFFPMDPGADASLGGMAATNASGSNALRYGAMRQNVLGLEVVVGDGSVIRSGTGTLKTSAGYDVTALFIGAEGTLGIITELTLRLQPIPARVVAGRLVFESLEHAAAAVVAIRSSGVQLSRLELVDESTVRAVNAYKDAEWEEAPTLFYEVGGSVAGTDAEAAEVDRIGRDSGAVATGRSADPDEIDRLWEARKHVAYAIMAQSPDEKMLTTDTCVPLDRLPGAIAHAKEAVRRYGIDGAILGHVGDGNVHVVFMVDTDDPDDVARAERFNDEVVRWALANGGTSTGEHGVGLGKRHFLAEEHGDLLPAMRAIKAHFDPQGIFNPGKVLPD